MKPAFSGTKGADPAAVVAWVRVAHRCDDASDPGLADRIDAGRRAAVMDARLERHVERRAARAGARLREGVDFGVRFAGRVVVALSDDAIVRDDDRADHGIRTGPAGSARREAQRPSRVCRVGLLAHGW